MHIRELVDRIIADGAITLAERDELARAVTYDPEVTPEEIEQVNRLTDLIASGAVHLAVSETDE